jgi:hypothetical protein
MFRRTPSRPLWPTVGNTVGLTTRFPGSYPMNVATACQTGWSGTLQRLCMQDTVWGRALGAALGGRESRILPRHSSTARQQDARARLPWREPRLYKVKRRLPGGVPSQNTVVECHRLAASLGVFPLRARS